MSSPLQHVPCIKHVQREYYAIVSASSAAVYLVPSRCGGGGEAIINPECDSSKEGATPSFVCCQVCAPPKSLRTAGYVVIPRSARNPAADRTCALGARSVVRVFGASLEGFLSLSPSFPPTVVVRRPSVFLLRKRRQRGGGIVSRFCYYRAACAETYVDRCAGAIVIRATFRRTRLLVFVGAAGEGETLGSDSAEYPQRGPIDVISRRSVPAGGIRRFERNTLRRKIEKKKKSAICRGAAAATSSISNS